MIAAARKPLRSPTKSLCYALGLPPTRTASIVSSCKTASVETSSFSSEQQRGRPVDRGNRGRHRPPEQRGQRRTGSAHTERAPARATTLAGVSVAPRRRTRRQLDVTSAPPRSVRGRCGVASHFAVRDAGLPSSSVFDEASQKVFLFNTYLFNKQATRQRRPGCMRATL